MIETEMGMVVRARGRDWRLLRAEAPHPAAMWESWDESEAMVRGNPDLVWETTVCDPVVLRSLLDAAERIGLVVAGPTVM